MGFKNTESVLVVVLAETRESDLTYTLFEKNLLKQLGADLALCVANNEREDRKNPFYQKAKFVWTYDEPEDWGDAFDAFQQRMGFDADWRQLLNVREQWLGGVRGPKEQLGSAGILLFFRLFLKDCLLKSGVLDQYDRFIITRSDFMHRVPHVPLKLLDRDSIWIPDGEQYGGFTDRHIVLSGNHVVDAVSISDPIIEDPGALHDSMRAFDQWNLEKFIWFRFKQLELLPKVKLFPYTMYAVRGLNGHTRWSEGKYDPELGYYIKYEWEYRGYRYAKRALILARGWSRIRIRIFNWLRSRKKRYVAREDVRFHQFVQ
ncbi:MAG: hypothetical protein ACPGKS_02875 [Coraliomargarita sp.]